MTTSTVAVLTRDRHDVLNRALAAWRQHLPDAARLLVVDDASTPPVTDAAFRFDTQAGVARGKNAGLALAMATGAEHLWLADNDAWPISPDWWRPYVASPVPHLMHCWGDRRFAGADDAHTYWTHPRGVLLYVHRSVVEQVGGMRPEFGMYGWEHVEWSRRIHTAGLTPAPFMDVTGADALWHCLDRAREVPRTITGRPRRAALEHGWTVAQQHAGSSEFVEYREDTAAWI